MGYHEEQFRNQVAEVLSEGGDEQKQLFEIMELFREAQYDVISGVTASRQDKT